MVKSQAADRLGLMLLRDALITPQQLDQALAESRSTGVRLGFSLVRLGFIEEGELAKMLARQHRVPAVELENAKFDPALLRLIPADVALRHLVVPLRRAGRVLTVAMADPGDTGAIDDLKFITRLEIEPVIAGEFSLRAIVQREYDVADERVREILRQLEMDGEVELLEDEEEDPGTLALQAQVEDAPVVRLINGILNDAVARGASDIHFECYEREVRVRYRIDGVLQEIMRPPPRLRAALISRFKILSDLNIAERRLPQDGRIKLRIGRRVIDFRVSTLPTLFGERIVLRILDKQGLSLDLDSFGMEPQARTDFENAILNPYGMVLVTGPTGSGKTTTLYSALSRLNTSEVNIMTAEDPVEYNLPGINQVQVRSDIGMTFSAALRAFLRQDPNVIMVGEIRDIDTASIAVRAALTGHLVLSTLHANDAPSTITRLIDMGMEPFNVASAVNAITAQRLVRRVCQNCAEPVPSAPEPLGRSGVPPEVRVGGVRRGKGCDACAGTGYRGRLGIYEVMAMSPALRRMVLEGASAEALREQAINEGMLTLRMDGLLKIARGMTTLEEVLKESAG